MDELLGLIADINPTEIASHIEQGNLAEWCEGWRQVATVTVENLRLSESDLKIIKNDICEIVFVRLLLVFSQSYRRSSKSSSNLDFA